MDFTEFRAFLDELTAASGAAIRPLFAQPSLEVELKSDLTPVTAADRGAEHVMRALIRHRYPGHGILGEEFGPERIDAEWVWVLDPVDGTRSFAAGCPLFGTLVALQHHGRPVFGAIHQPVLGQLLVGDGASATLDGRAVRCRPTRSIEESTFLTTDWLSPARHQNGAGFEALCRRVRLARTWGDCYGYLLLAAGWADIMCDPVMNPWDIAALVPVVRGAGGVITDWQGRDPVGAASIVAAATAELHRAVIDQLAS
jgi:myo-inositol-1(or 4)-monophosphatase